MKRENNQYILKLIESAQNGKRHSFIELCEMFKKHIFGLCIRILLNPKLTEEVTKEVFITAWMKIKDYNGETKFNSWLNVIAIYTIFDEISSQTREKELSENTKGFVSDTKIKSDLIPDTKIQELLLELPKLERMIFVLNDIENHSLKEISELIEGISPFEIKVILKQTRRKYLRKDDSLKNGREYFKIVSSSECFLNPPDGLLDRMMDNLHDEARIEKIRKDKILQQRVQKAIVKKTEREAQRKKTEIKLPKISKPSFNFPLKRVAIIAFIIISIGFVLYKFSSDSNAPWKIKPVKGVCLVNDLKPIEYKLNENETITTVAEAKTNIVMEHVGKITMYEKASFNLNVASDVLSEITIIKGRITANTLDQKGKLKIYFSNGFLELDNVNATFLYNENNKNIEVFEGEGFLKFKDQTIFLAKGNRIELNPNSKFIIPFHKTLNEQNRLFVHSYIKDFNIVSLRNYLSNTTSADAITLLNLMLICKENDKISIFNKLNGFYPLPKTLQKAKLLKLNDEAIKEWFDEIEWQL